MRIALETGTHSNWVRTHLESLGHEVIVANARELRAITGSDRKSDPEDARKLALYVRVDHRILRPVQHPSMEAQQDLTIVRAREALVRARTLLINAARGLVKTLGHAGSRLFPNLAARTAFTLLPNPLLSRDSESYVWLSR